MKSSATLMSWFRWRFVGYGLLIFVVGAVAWPNYLTSPPPSPRTRAWMNMRAIHVALEHYHGDHGAFPPRDGLWRITTPVVYLTHLVPDPLAETADLPHRYHTDGTRFIVGSFGPDRDEATGGDLPWSDAEAMNALLADHTRLLPYTYDPTNGAFSEGDFWRVGGNAIQDASPP